MLTCVLTCSFSHHHIHNAYTKRLGVEASKCRAYEDGEAGLESAFRAGMQVVDVRDMDGYPLCEGLRDAMEETRANRTWLKSDVASES
jgi:beta-phosphoglucomutase-like phosphatase (HAD superfamily)